jgi:hypothetical protein
MTAIKRFPLSLRTTKELREKLEKAAKDTGRSLAQEIEFRLEQSFDREAVVESVVSSVTKYLDLARANAPRPPRMPASVGKSLIKAKSRAR